MRTLLFWTAMLSCTWAATVCAKEIKKSYHEVFDVNTASVLHLKNGDGDVTITPWNRNQLDITVEYRADLSGCTGSKSEFEVTFEQKGNHIYVADKESHYMTHGRIQMVRYVYEIKAPPYVKLDLKSSDGSVKISGWKSRIDCKLSDGNIELSDIEADVNVKISDGNLVVNKLTGNLKVKGSDGNLGISGVVGAELSVEISDGRLRLSNSQANVDIRASDGRITLDKVKAQRLDVKTSDGDIDANLLATANPNWLFKSSDGHIKIKTNRTISANYTFKSGDGLISINHPDNHPLEQKSRHVSGRLGTGNGTIRVHSSDGDVSLTAK